MNLAAALILTALITLTAILPVAILATLITPEDAARLTAHLLRSIAGLATFIPRYLRAVIAELRPDPPSDAPPKVRRDALFKERQAWRAKNAHSKE